MNDKELINKLIENKLIAKIGNKYIFTDLTNYYIENKELIETSFINSLDNVDNSNLKSDYISNKKDDTISIKEVLSEEDLINRVRNTKDVKVIIESDGFKLWATNLNKKFPTSKMMKDYTNGNNIRNLRETTTGKYGFLNKLKKWFKETDYIYCPIIVEYAVLKYLTEEWQKSNLRYCKNSSNFINKQHEPSKLTAECEIIQELLDSNELTLEAMYLVITDTNIATANSEVISSIDEEVDIWTTTIYNDNDNDNK